MLVLIVALLLRKLGFLTFPSPWTPDANMIVSATVTILPRRAHEKSVHNVHC